MILVEMPVDMSLEIAVGFLVVESLRAHRTLPEVLRGIADAHVLDEFVDRRRVAKKLCIAQRTDPYFDVVSVDENETRILRVDVVTVTFIHGMTEIFIHGMFGSRNYPVVPRGRRAFDPGRDGAELWVVRLTADFQNRLFGGRGWQVRFAYSRDGRILRFGQQFLIGSILFFEFRTKSLLEQFFRRPRRWSNL